MKITNDHGNPGKVIVGFQAMPTSIVTKLEVLLTLECPWKCKDCCRALNICCPEDSHITVEQAERLIQYIRKERIIIRRMKIDGGEITCNPNLEKLLWTFQSAVPEVFPRLRIQTAYSKKHFRGRYNLPRGIKIRFDPQTKKNFKQHHLPVFISPTEIGLLSEGSPPTRGSWLTKKPCNNQAYCGRAFSRWGFTACGQEPILGVLLGIDPFSTTFKEWADPEICKHCVFSCGWVKSRKMRSAAAKGEIPLISKVFNFSSLAENYHQLLENKTPW